MYLQGIWTVGENNLSYPFSKCKKIIFLYRKSRKFLTLLFSSGLHCFIVLDCRTEVYSLESVKLHGFRGLLSGVGSWMGWFNNLRGLRGFIKFWRRSVNFWCGPKSLRWSKILLSLVRVQNFAWVGLGAKSSMIQTFAWFNSQSCSMF